MSLLSRGTETVTVFPEAVRTDSDGNTITAPGTSIFGPSNPIIALYQLHFAGFGAIPGHVGFDKVEAGKEGAVDTHAYAHYLHHKYFEVNYSDGMLPIDKWIGTWHDGTREGDRLMQERFRKKRDKMNAGAADQT